MESFAMTEFKPIKEGKVREIYDNGDSLIMVATDRISAFDVILKNKVTNKGNEKFAIHVLGIRSGILGFTGKTRFDSLE